MRSFCLRFRGLLPALLALALLPGLAVRARDLEDDDEQTAGRAPSLLAKLQTVHYGIVAGRLMAASDRNDTSMTLNLTNQVKRERVSIDVTTGLPTIHYEMTAASEELLIDVVEAAQFTIRRTHKDKSRAALEFQQLRHGELVLSIGDGNEKTTIRSASLWHLALAEPKICRVELFPVLEMMRPSWHLASTAGAIEESLSRWAEAHRVADRRVWQAWVTALGSRKFTERQAAERNLLDAGPAVLPFLEHLVQDRLDAEQRSRLRNVVSLLDDDHEDTVDRVVTWLAADPEIWLALLCRPDEGRRRLAGQQLTRLLGSSIDFDAAADDATRAVQIGRLRAGLNVAPHTAPR